MGSRSGGTSSLPLVLHAPLPRRRVFPNFTLDAGPGLGVLVSDDHTLPLENRVGGAKEGIQGLSRRDGVLK